MTTSDRLDAAAMRRAMQELHAHCDGAVQRDTKGFSKSHASIGAYLAQTPVAQWETDDHTTAWYLCLFHHKQLAHYGIEVPASNDKDEQAWRSTLTRAQRHAKRPVNVEVQGGPHSQPALHVTDARGKVRKILLSKLTAQDLRDLARQYPQLDTEALCAEIEGLKRLTLSVTSRSPYNKNHRAAQSLSLTAGASVPKDLLPNLYAKLQEEGVSGLYLSGKALELPPTLQHQRSVMRAVPQDALNIPEPDALAAALEQNHVVSLPYHPQQHNLYWEANHEGQFRLLAYGPYSDQWLRVARTVTGRHWNGEADEFPASELDAVLALLTTPTPQGQPLGTSWLSPEELVHVREVGREEAAKAALAQAQAERERHQAEQAERERVAVTEVDLDGKPHVLFAFKYDPPKAKLIQSCCAARYAAPPQAPQKGYYVRLSDETLPGIMQAADKAELRVSPELIARFDLTKQRQQAQAPLDEQAMTLIAQERGGQEVTPPALPGVVAALKGHQHLIPTVWPLTRKMLLADEQGLGKSLEAICALITERHASPLRTVLVCPSNLTENWQAEFEEHAPQQFKTFVASGRTPSSIPESAEVIIIGWSVLKAWLEALSAWQPTVLIADEGQLAKSGSEGPWGSQRGAAALTLAQRVRNGGGGVMVLTGTPVDTRPLDVLALLNILGVEQVFGGEKKFKDRYCGPRQITAPVMVRTGSGMVREMRRITTYKGASHTGELHARLAQYPWYVRRTKRLLVEKGEMQPKVVNGVDWYDYATPQQPRLVALTLHWQERYDAAVKEFHLYLIGRVTQKYPHWHALSLTDLRAIVEQELANVLPKLTLMREVLGHAKIDAVCQRARELNAQGEQVVIIAHHREVIDEYAKRLCTSRVLKIQGGMSVKEVEAAKLYFNTHGVEQAPVMVLSQDAAKLGHTLCLQRKLAGLPEARHVLIAEEGYNASPEAQAMDRVWRIPQTRTVYVENILAADTLDEGLFNLKLAKRLAAAAITDGEAVDGDADLTGMLSYWIQGLNFLEAAQQLPPEPGEYLEGE